MAKPLRPNDHASRKRKRRQAGPSEWSATIDAMNRQRRRDQRLARREPARGTGDHGRM